VVFGTKRDQKSDADAQEDVIGTLYPDSYRGEAPMTAAAMDLRRDAGNESVIDPHARFNGKYMSDRDLRIEGEAQGEIECMGTLIIAPQARVRALIKALHVIINGDYEGEVDCGGRFEVGSTGRVRGKVKTQVLVVKEGAHWEGSVLMSHEGARPAAAAGQQPGQAKPTGPTISPTQGPSQPQPPGASQGSIFSKQDREGAPAASGGERQATGPGGDRT
jgi:cytoskeletal protein CcmA (bactofilin family)